MPNGRHEPDCFTCAAWATGERRQGHCTLHRFVMPAFSNHIVCRDWRANWNPDVKSPFTSLAPGYLYRWEEYGRTGPDAIGRFEEIREFLLDRVLNLFENPEHGWSLYVDPWDYDLFPPAGRPMAIRLDGGVLPFSILDIPVTTTYTNHDSSGLLHMEDPTETKRVITPAEGNAARLQEWIERYHDVPRARAQKAKSLVDPKHLYKDKVLRIMVRIVGEPLNGSYELVPLDA